MRGVQYLLNESAFVLGLLARHWNCGLLEGISEAVSQPDLPFAADTRPKLFGQPVIQDEILSEADAIVGVARKVMMVQGQSV